MEAIAQYLATLPSGLDSYPSVKTKASALVGFFDEEAIRPHLPPSVLASIIGMPASSWVSEVHATVAHVAMREICFSSDADYLEYARKQNYRLVSSPLYRHAFRLFRPGRLARLVNASWGLFHRGSSLRSAAETSNSLTFILQHPRGLWPNFVRRSLLTGGTEALRVGGTESHGTVLSETATQARARLEW